MATLMLAVTPYSPSRQRGLDPANLQCSFDLRGVLPTHFLKCHSLPRPHHVGSDIVGHEAVVNKVWLNILQPEKREIVDEFVVLKVA